MSWPSTSSIPTSRTLTKSKNPLTIGHLRKITSTTYGIHVGANFDGNTIEIDGAVHGDQAGVFCESDDTTIHIGSTAKVTGNAGIAVTGDNISVVNDSKIAAAAYGVFSGATHLTFTNENTIKADSAIYVVSDTHIVNAEGATIIGKTFAVSLGSSSLVNHGAITATQDAVVGGDGTTTVVNDGTITGNRSRRWR